MKKEEDNFGEKKAKTNGKNTCGEIYSCNSQLAQY